MAPSEFEKAFGPAPSPRRSKSFLSRLLRRRKYDDSNESVSVARNQSELSPDWQPHDSVDEESDAGSEEATAEKQSTAKGQTQSEEHPPQASSTPRSIAAAILGIATVDGTVDAIDKATANVGEPMASRSTAELSDTLPPRASEIEVTGQLDPGPVEDIPDLFFHPGMTSARPLPLSSIREYYHSPTGGSFEVLDQRFWSQYPEGFTFASTLPARNNTDASYYTAPMPRNISTASNTSYRSASYRTAPYLNGLSNASYHTAQYLNGLSNASMQSRVLFTSQRDRHEDRGLPTPSVPKVSREQNPSFLDMESRNPSDAVSKSEWLTHLQKKGILLSDYEALDWSGKGQHVEYGADEQSLIPLKVERTIGHSATALVQAVRCRRIRLARKRIRCNRRLTPYDAVMEVKHLQSLQHCHLIRVVGTYIIRKDLSILLYPVTEWNLEEFMDDTVDRLSELKDFSNSYDHRSRILSLRAFFGCICNAIDYIHRMNVKHMDIKPKNFLVRVTTTPLVDRLDKFKVYLADFGIARSYSSPQEAETDSRTSFTRTYAAPEVVMQETRGFSADIFSLGCVFTEMLATILSTVTGNLRVELQDVRENDEGDTAYSANIVAVQKWLQSIDKQDFFNDPRYAHVRKANLSLVEKITYCLDAVPALRPSSEDLAICTEPLRCLKCESGPEPFEAAEPLGSATVA